MSIGEQEGRRGPASLLFVCPCPYSKCDGSHDKQERYRFHATQEAVQACQKKNLTRLGYKQLGPREWENPESGRILVLSRKAPRSKPGKKGRHMGKPVAPVKVW